MKISHLYVYPIKSLRGVEVSSWEVSKTGLRYDRKFMLLRIKDASIKPPTLQNMAVSGFPQMTLFYTEISSGERGADREIKVTYKPPGDASSNRSISIPLAPDASGFPVLDVVMHSSSTKAYDMGSVYNEWFSSCFGFDVILAYIDKNLRPILGTFAPSASNVLSNKSSGFFSRLHVLPSLRWATEPEGITFADCASFLVINEKSVDDASSRLEGDEKMDLTKFRPNIVLSGAEKAWEEDFWGEIAISTNSNDKTETVSIVLTKNCVRCKSINIDYATGKAGTGEAGKMLKKLMKDRRVDAGSKWSPVFGRYGFLTEGDGKTIEVVDDVEVATQLEERTTWDWPDIG